MKKSSGTYTFMCEKTKTGWSAYLMNIEYGNSVITTFSTIKEMHKNCLEVLNLYLEDLGVEATIENIIFKFEK